MNIGPEMSPRLFEKCVSTLSSKTELFIGVSSQTGWGEMTVMTVGSFQVFIEWVTLTRVLQVKINVYQKNMIIIFFV